LAGRAPPLIGSRPAGSWNDSASILEGESDDWVVGRRSASETVEALEVAASCEEAQRWVDERLAHQG
jgi:hypothetical protein